MKLNKVLILIALPLFSIILLSTFAFASISDWFGFFKKKDVQESPSASLNVSVSIGNNAPRINNITFDNPQEIVEGGVKIVHIYFEAEDNNGNDDLAPSTAQLTINKSGNSDKIINCSLFSSPSAIKAIYECNMQIEYYQQAGEWEIMAGIKDKANTQANKIAMLVINEQMSFTLSPSVVDFPSTLSPGDINVISSAESRPILLKNLGNKDIVFDQANNRGIHITAKDLTGEIDSSKKIDASLISVKGSTDSANPPSECLTGDAMSDDAPVLITDASIPRGDNTNINNQQPIYLCIKRLDNSLSAQTYSAKGAGAWLVSIS